MNYDTPPPPTHPIEVKFNATDYIRAYEWCVDNLNNDEWGYYTEQNYDWPELNLLIMNFTNKKSATLFKMFWR
jgi:hypothetical protein